MDRAKGAVQDFMKKSGHHDTSVHEKVAPAVTHETRLPTQHENVQTAIDKEIHQDHHHTSVQPVADKQVLPEEHSHNLVGVEHRSFEHGDAKDTESRLASEAGRFKNERVVEDTQHTHSVAPVVAGEHIHHHVHETIQPVVQREVLQPSVVHTTVPVHEVHHNASQHHTASALPAVSVTDFKKQGGVLGGREERSDAFEGEPRSVGGNLSKGADKYATTGSGSTGHHSSTRSGMEDGTDKYATTGSGSTGHHSSTRSGMEDGTNGSNYRTTGTNESVGKPSMKDKINPKVDADGDGKAGFMK